MSPSFRQRLFVFFLVTPALIILLGVVVYPFVYNVIISLSNMNLRHIRDWEIVGFRNYVKVFTEPSQPDFYVIFIKTVVWTVVNLFFHVVLGVFLALVLNQKEIRGKGIFRTILVLPWAVPQLIVALTWRGMFNYEYGSINQLLTKAGLPAVEWLRGPTEAFIAAIITNVWLGFPFMMVIALGALQSIPHDLYEAAEIDGASWHHKLRAITIPLIKPVMVPAITLGTIWTFNNLNIIWLVSNAGEPSDNTHILVSFVYKAAFNFYRYGYGAALSMIIFFILLAFSWVFMRRTKATEAVY
ncbi:MAG: sugar ABC transporter permease [Bacteroidetes bacterium]|nr:sugar ABC transporter permease [Bacteroidota bacterium]